VAAVLRTPMRSLAAAALRHLPRPAPTSAPAGDGPGGDFCVAAHVRGRDGEAHGAARRLVAGEARRAGVLSPAMAFDPASLLDELAVHGVRWSVSAPGS